MTSSLKSLKAHDVQQNMFSYFIYLLKSESHQQLNQSFLVFFLPLPERKWWQISCPGINSWKEKSFPVDRKPNSLPLVSDRSPQFGFRVRSFPSLLVEWSVRELQPFSLKLPNTQLRYFWSCSRFTPILGCRQCARVRVRKNFKVNIADIAQMQK